MQPDPERALELRVYPKDGCKHFILFDPEVFLGNLAELRNVEPSQCVNGLLEKALEKALVIPEDPEDFYAPPQYFRVEFLMNGIPDRDFEVEAFWRGHRYEENTQTWWGRPLFALRNWCEARLYGKP